MRKESLTDAWFVSAGDGHVEDQLLSLSQIFARYSDGGTQTGKSVLILHENQRNRKDPAWIDLDLDSFEPTERAEGKQRHTSGRSGDADAERGRSSRRNKRRTRGMLLQLIVVVVVLLIGVGAWYVYTHEEEEQITFVSEEEAHNRMLATLQQNLIQNNPDASAEEGEPIRTVVSATQRMLMIKNSNLEAWPSFKLNITTTDGKVYRCSFDQSIPAYSTLSISMRKILTDKDEALSREDLRSGTTIELQIPGYKSWSSKL